MSRESDAIATAHSHSIGVLEQAVNGLNESIRELKTAVDGLRKDIATLKAEQDKARGALVIIGAAVGFVLTTVGGIVIHLITRK